MLAVDLLVESFEAATPTGDSGLVADPNSDIFYLGSNDFWTRTNGASPAIGTAGETAGSPSYNSQDGSFYFAGEDLDASDFSNTKTLEIQNINIGGHNNLAFTGLFAADGVSSGIPRYDAGEGLLVEYKIDTGAFIPALAFRAEGASDTHIALDTNLDGTGDGTRLTPAFTQYGFSIPTTGANLTLRITGTSSASSEEFAFDFFKVTGDVVSSNQAPLASLTSAPSVGEAEIGQTSYSFDVTYTDPDVGGAIDFSDIDTGDVTVTGPGGPLTVTSAVASPMSDASPIVVTYTVATPDPGGWRDTLDNGVYTIDMNASEVSDTDGSPLSVAAGSLGSFTVAATNTNPTVSAVNAATVTNANLGETSYSFAVTYSDVGGIDTSSIGTGDVTVTGPGGPLTVTGGTTTDPNGSTTVTATYTVATPNVGGWSAADDGTYNIAIVASEVDDVLGASVAAGAAGSFLVDSTLLMIESFEAATPTGDSGKVADPNTDIFYASSNDFWTRTDGANPAIATAGETAGNPSYAGQDGSFYFAGEDLDHSDGSATKTLEIQAINIAGFENVTFTGAFAADGVSGGIPRHDGGEGLLVEYSVDSGPFTNGVAFRGVGPGDDTAIRQDTDFDGFGDPAGALLTPTFADFGFSIPSGTNLTLRITGTSTASSEEFAFDFFRINGDPGATPAATLTAAPNVGEPEIGDTTYDFDVTYTDPDGNIDFSTIGTSDVIVTGPGGPLTVTGVSASPMSDNPSIVVTYTVATPDPGGWRDTLDNGVYTIDVSASEVGDDDASQNFVPGGNLGSFTVAATNTDPTFVALNAPTVTNAQLGQTSYSFTVTYTDVGGIDTSSIGTSDVTVTGPGGPLTVTGGTTADPNGSTTVTATYTVATPNAAGWGAADDGTYNIAVVANEVDDVLGASVAAGALGSFLVDSTLVLIESFEAAVPTGDTGKVADPNNDIFYGGSSDFWTRTDGANPAIATAEETAGNPSYNGQDGSFYFAGEDLDHSDGSPTKTLEIQNIDIGNFENLTFSGFFAADGVSSGIPRHDVGEGLLVEYSVDGGAFTNGLAFRAVGPGDDTAIRQDTNFDGFGDGALLTPTFADFGFNIPDGSSLTLRITGTSTASSEEFAFDFFRINGDPVNSPLNSLALNEFLPDPNSAATNFDTDTNGVANDTDEFIEFYNTSASTLDIGGLQLWDAGADNWFSIPAGTMLDPGGFATVVIGLQAGGALPTVPAGSHIFDASRGSAVLNNSGDNIVLYDPISDLYLQAKYNNDADDDPTTYTGFSGTATRLGTILDFGTDTDGVSLALDPDGATGNPVRHTAIGGGFTQGTPGTSNVDAGAPTVTLTSSPTSMNEDDSGTLDFTFSRTGPLFTELTVDFGVGGLATPGVDYVQSGADTFGATGMITLASGSATGTINVDPTTDATVELDETVQLDITANANYIVGSPGSATSTINNDESATISINDVSQLEMDSGTSDFTFVLELDKDVDTNISFDIDNVDDEAIAGEDYTGFTTIGVSTSSAGTILTLNVPVNGDEKVELDEDFFIRLSNLSTSGRAVHFTGGGLTLDGTGTIQNDDSAILTIEDVSVQEDVGSGTLDLVVNLDHPLDITLTVDVVLGGGGSTATGGTIDYDDTTQQVTFPAGSNTGQTVSIPITNDNDIEIPDEFFEVNMSIVTALGGRGVDDSDSAIGTIIDDDTTPPILLVGDLNYTEGDNGGNPVQINPAGILNDPDGDSEWNGGSLSAQITGNSEAADELSIPDNIVGNINTDGTDLRNGTTVIGTLSAAEGTVTGGTQLTITFNANATNALVQQVLRAISYRTTSGDPSTLDRTVSLSATDRKGGNATNASTIFVTAVNNPATLTFDNVVAVPEDANTDNPIKVADVVINDPDGGPNVLTLGGGADDSFFTLTGTELFLNAQTLLDFETKPTYSTVISVDDATIAGSPDDTEPFTLQIVDVNEPPVVQALNRLNQILESEILNNSLRVADINVVDDALGSANLAITGPDAGFFEFQGAELHLKAGTVLDFETQPFYNVTVEADDSTIPGNPDSDVDVVLAVLDVFEPPEVNVVVNAVDIPDRGIVNFGDHAVAGPPPQRVLVVENNGFEDLVIQPAVVPAGYTLVGSNFAPNTTIAPGANASITVEMDTSIAGVVSGILTFANNDPDESNYRITLSGAVLLPTLTPRPLPEGLLIDNGDSGFFETGGWHDVTGFGFDNDALAAVGSDGARRAIWAYGGLTPGQYDVSLTWLFGSDRGDEVPVVIRDGIAGPILSSLTVDQRVSPDGQVLGGRPFEILDRVNLSSDTLIVELSNLDQPKAVIADAVLITPFTPPPAQPEITVRSGGNDVPDGSTFNLPTVTVGGPGNNTIVVRNDGTADLILQPISVTGPAFSISPNFAPNQVVPAGGQATFGLNVNTSTAGIFNGTLTMNNNDSDENPFDLQLAVTVRDPGAPSVLIDDGDPEFALTGNWVNVPLYGHAQDAKIITSSKTGTATWTFSGLAAGDYNVSTTWLNGNDRWDAVPYVIRDGAAGPILATIPVDQTVAPSGPSIGGRPFSSLGTVTLSGTELVVEVDNAGATGHVVTDAVQIELAVPAPNAPEIDVTQGALTVLDDSSFSFGSAEQGDPAISKTFTVENTGTADLVLEPLSLTGTGFSLTSPNFSPGQVLTPGNTADITVELDTSAVDSFFATLSFANNDSDENPFNFDLSGNVNVPQPAGVQIIDDGDSGFSRVGNWATVNGFGFGKDALAGNGINGVETAQWVFDNLTPGTTHEVSTTWLRGSDREATVTYIIRDGVGGAVLATVVVDQTQNPTGGVTEGGRPFQMLDAVTISGTQLVVELSTAGSTKAVIADAVRIAQQ